MDFFNNPITLSGVYDKKEPDTGWNQGPAQCISVSIPVEVQEIAVGRVDKCSPNRQIYFLEM
jgi:hypothetical protein